MKIDSVQIQNFRSFKDETIEFNNYTCIVGPNGSGKSNILRALNIFFGESEGSNTDIKTLSAEDFHNKDTSVPITITITFTDLNDEAKNDFKHYVRQDKLVVSAVAVFDPNSQTAQVKQYGQRMGIGDFKEYFKALNDNAPVAKLREHYELCREKHPDLPSESVKDKMTQALRDYEERHPEKCERIPSEEQFYGFSKGKNLLEKYIQYVYVPAVKEITDEQKEAKNTALGKLIARTVRARVNFTDQIQQIKERVQTDYQNLISNNQKALDEISDSLNRRLKTWAHPDATLRLTWDKDEKSIKVDEPFAKIIAGEEGFEGDLARFGHGFQRSYFLALLQEISGCDDPTAPKLLLACEEPELFQHPPQAKHLFSVFQKLSEANSQVIVCTHSPYFVSGERFEDIRLVRKSNNESNVTQVTIEDVTKMIPDFKKPEGLRAKLNQNLQPSINEMFFATRLILVEGLEDFAYITTYIHLMEKADEFRRLGCHIVPVNGKNSLPRIISIAKSFKIPHYVIFDADTDIKDNKDNNMRVNSQILSLCETTLPDPIPLVYNSNNLTMWSKNINETVKNDFGDNYKKYSEKARVEYGCENNLDKNILFIATLLENAWKDGIKSTSLEELCERIMEFAKDN